ncbi:MAG: hypothetical protein U0414_05910 [Polyangiaceae bacterium]
MAREVRRVIARQGDCVYSIAAAHGVGDVQSILDHPDNHELFQGTGRSAGILARGDVVTVPVQRNQHSVSQDQTLRVQATPPRTRLKLVLKDQARSPLANESVVLRVPGSEQTRQATTDGDGLLDEPVPARARAILVEIPRLHETLLVQLGHMDPLEDESGVRKRLANLNYLPPSAEATDDELAAAIALFREDHGLAADGEESELLQALEAAHGS